MKGIITSILAIYFIIFGVSFLVGNLSRLRGENCKVIVADYLFLGLTRLPCEVK